jgi:hypothetical protein
VNLGITSWEGRFLVLQTSELRDHEITRGRKDKGVITTLGLARWELILGAWKNPTEYSWSGPLCSFRRVLVGIGRAISALELEDPDWEFMQP